MRLHAKISSQFYALGLIEYDVLPGAVFTYTYNEELDSGSIVIPHLRRRMSGLSPYDWVKVYDEDGDFSRTMLVDDFTETRPNIGIPYYDYTIDLMSETKLLEKTQLPNRQWQHSLTGERKTIREAIFETCSLYVPKIKVKTDDSWEYERLIDFSDFGDSSSEAYKKFDVGMADISLSQPTLRQALSAMMTQIGCLPVVKDGKLTWLDLRATPTALTMYGDTFAQEQRSNSSDSYVNELVCQGDGILDSENSSVSETLGFRDRENAFLKQTENLYLETRYPIYHVESLKMGAYAITSKFIELLTESYADDSVYLQINQDSTAWTIRFISASASGITYSAKNIKVVFLKQSTEQLGVFSYEKVSERNPSDQVFSSDESAVLIYPWNYGDSVCVIYDLYLSGVKLGTAYRRYNGEPTVWPSDDYYDGNLFGKLTYDISALCLENGKRSLLDTDFLKMSKSSIKSLSDLAKWLYGTVGYSVGDTKITGFSSTYSYFPTDSWWEAMSGGEKTATYIENIVERLKSYPSSLDPESILRIACQWLFGDQSYMGYIVTSGSTQTIKLNSDGRGTFKLLNPYDSDSANFSCLWFDVEYQPLNSLSVRYSKSNKDIPIPFQQLDTPTSSVSSMDALAANETDSVDRLGNAATSLSQYADDDHIDEIQWLSDGLLSRGSDVVFQAVYSIDVNGIAANYFMSEAAIMRNYFTSIQTKYRAYQYVGYDQAVVRKENAKVYALLSQTDYPDMDEKITFGPFDETDESSKADLLSPFADEKAGDHEFGRISSGYVASEGAYSTETYVEADYSATTNEVKFSLDLIADPEGTVSFEVIDRNSGKDVSSSFSYSLNTPEEGSYKFPSVAMEGTLEGYEYLVFRAYVTLTYEAKAAFKSECSVVTYRNSVMLNVMEFDNVSAGTAQIVDTGYNDIGGGIPQKWYMWPEEYHDAHSIGWSNLGFDDIYYNDDWEAVSKAIISLPNLYPFTKMPYSEGPTTLISLKDNAYHKDYSETINQTLQIEYYSDDENVVFGEYFADSICWKSGNGGEWQKGILRKEYSGRGEFAIIQPTEEDEPMALSDCLSISTTDMSVSVTANPTATENVRVVLWKEDHGDYVIRDVIEFENGKGKTYYLRLNDTKTQKAYIKSDVKYLGYLIPAETNL